MKVAVIEFPTKCLVGVVSDEDAMLIEADFGLFQPEDDAALPASEEAHGALVRLQYPGREDTSSWFQPGPLAGEQQFVVQNFVSMLGVSRRTVDLNQAIAADVYETVDGRTAIISADGVKPAGQPASDEPLVQRYLTALETAGIKPARVGGRQKVQREPTA